MTSTPTTPPSRWLLILTILVVIVFTALRIWLAATLDLRSDEAYYWSWSKQWVPSYLDHPPMVAWFEHIGQAIFGDTTLGARFGQILSLPIIEFFLADIARRRTGSWNAALFVVVALECTIYYSLVVIVIEPSIPMLVFVGLLFWSLCRLDETMNPRWWLLVGVAGGLAILSKLEVFLLAPALLLFVLPKRHRAWLTTPWPWAAIGIAFVICIPFLVWNARHDWVTLGFQSARLNVGSSISTKELFKFLVFDFLCAGLLLMPINMVQGVRLTIRSVLRWQPFEMMIAVAFVFPLGLFLVRSLNMLINQSWAYFIWPIGTLALVLSLHWAGRWLGARIILFLVAIPGAVFTSWLFYHATIDPDIWLGRGDPFGQDAGFEEMSQRVLADARANGATWIATTEYRTYSNLLWHIGKDIPVIQINQRSRFLDFAPIDPKSYDGKALYVHQLPAPPQLDGTERQPVEVVPVIWRGMTMNEITVETLDHFTPSLDPAGDLNSVSATFNWY